MKGVNNPENERKTIQSEVRVFWLVVYMTSGGCCLDPDLSHIVLVKRVETDEGGVQGGQSLVQIPLSVSGNGGSKHFFLCCFEFFLLHRLAGLLGLDCVHLGNEEMAQALKWCGCLRKGNL